MKPSESIKSKIKFFENLCLTTKRCSAGVPTIGYGHTGPEVKMGQKITKERAEEIFNKDIDMISAEVLKVIPPDIDQCKFDALVSFTFNLGIAALKRSALLKKIKANPEDPGIRNQFLRWVYAAGKKLPGLVKRRAMEADHYFGKI
ncbi:MAG: lysozyme [Muribaculaceae bacterium]|nr:lysozyme [Muribaculaceae bacterium]